MSSIRNFEQLSQLKAGSRKCIDINDQLSNETINFSQLQQSLEMPKKQNIIVEKPMNKYFSFVNKIYETRVFKRSSKSLDNSETLLKSSSSTVSSLLSDLSCLEQCSSNDSGCFTRSSGLSTTDSTDDINELDEVNEVNEVEVKKMKSLCHEIFGKIKTNQSLKPQISVQTVDLNGKRQRRKKTTSTAKILTILFDYEDLDNFNSIKFSVVKGETVHLIREYNEKYYLVAKTLNGTLGYLPKDYTIDLKEIKRKLRNNLKKQAMPNFNVKLTQL